MLIICKLITFGTCFSVCLVVLTIEGVDYLKRCWSFDHVKQHSQIVVFTIIRINSMYSSQCPCRNYPSHLRMPCALFMQISRLHTNEKKAETTMSLPLYACLHMYLIDLTKLQVSMLISSLFFWSSDYHRHQFVYLGNAHMDAFGAFSVFHVW